MTFCGRITGETEGTGYLRIADHASGSKSHSGSPTMGREPRAVSELVYSIQSTTVSFRIPPKRERNRLRPKPSGSRSLGCTSGMNNLGIKRNYFKRGDAEARRKM